MRLALLLAPLPLASAHGRVTKITTANNTIYSGWDPEFSTPLSHLAAWSADNLGNIFVPPSGFNTSATSCHFNATPGALHIDITAGDTLNIQWNEWPTSHVGPVLTYLAACHESCATAKAESLKWVKIDELGWLNSTGWNVLNLGGTWATNVLIANKFQWTVRIPQGLEEGHYVLRHEIIALHVAEKLNGAQAYPQCVNVRVTSGGAKVLEAGTFGQKLYAMRDTGVLVDVHKKLEEYEIPGPRVWGSASHVKQPSE
jgi:cellulase